VVGLGLSFKKSGLDLDRKYESPLISAVRRIKRFWSNLVAFFVVLVSLLCLCSECYAWLVLLLLKNPINKLKVVRAFSKTLLRIENLKCEVD